MAVQSHTQLLSDLRKLSRAKRMRDAVASVLVCAGFASIAGAVLLVIGVSPIFAGLVITAGGVVGLFRTQATTSLSLAATLDRAANSNEALLTAASIDAATAEQIRILPRAFEVLSRSRILLRNETRHAARRATIGASLLIASMASAFLLMPERALIAWGTMPENDVVLASTPLLTSGALSPSGQRSMRGSPGLLGKAEAESGNSAAISSSELEIDAEENRGDESRQTSDTSLAAGGDSIGQGEARSKDSEDVANEIRATETRSGTSRSPDSSGRIAVRPGAGIGVGAGLGNEAQNTKNMDENSTRGGIAQDTQTLPVSVSESSLAAASSDALVPDGKASLRRVPLAYRRIVRDFFQGDAERTEQR